jgi:L-lactate dehydrogenase complex protein LldF
MCTTLPEMLITVLGIEKLIPSWRDLEVFLALLPRSSTAERMNPYTSIWTGVAGGDGPRAFHVILLDNGRTNVLALHCIRCSACLNVCPVYERTGGHAYGSVYPGPIGAILTPLMSDLQQHRSLPYASSLCGACYDVCPVKIDIPKVLVHLRDRVVHEPAPGAPRLDREALTMRGLARVFASRRAYEAAQRAGRRGQGPFVRRDGTLKQLPGPLAAWMTARDLPALPRQSFREWFKAERG